MVEVRIRVRVTIKLRVRFRLVICKLHVHCFEMVKCILQIMQIDKSHPALIQYSKEVAFHLAVMIIVISRDVKIVCF